MAIVQRSTIAALLEGMDEESPLVAPAYAYTDAERCELIGARVAETIRRDTGLVRSSHRYADWLGIECPSVRAAVWLMRTTSVLNVVSRREGTVLFVPINPATDPEGEIVAESLVLADRLRVAKGVM